MERTAVRSTDIAIIGYDQNQKILEIAFRAGSVYHYLNVPADVYQTFMKAPSHGTFFQSQIRDKFACNKVK